MKKTFILTLIFMLTFTFINIIELPTILANESFNDDNNQDNLRIDSEETTGEIDDQEQDLEENEEEKTNGVEKEENEVGKTEENTINNGEEIKTQEEVETSNNGEEIKTQEEVETSSTKSNLSNIISITEKNISRLGHLNSSTVKIYKELGNEAAGVESGADYKDSVYYIKKQAELKGQLYYLLSNNASSTTGLVGWVKSEDIRTHPHVGVDTKKKVFYIKGTGNGYSRAWGGSANLVYNLSDKKGLEFIVNKTEKVGNNTWYRGVLDGKTTWIHSSYLMTEDESGSVINEKTVSMLGHLKKTVTKAYEELGNNTSSVELGKDYKDSVYYIKKQAELNGQLYYLLSNNASSTTGLVGWVKSEDVRTHSHVGVDIKKKTFYIKGTGNGYSRAWGGSANLVYKLAEKKDRQFIVNKTERVGNNTWYRGVLDGKTTWIHSSYLEVLKETKTSKLGHLNSTTVKIYKELGNDAAGVESGVAYKDSVYYIKKQAELNNQLYYLLSNDASSTTGLVGWVKADDVRTHSHVGVDTKKKIFYIKGTGNGYNRAWGGSANLVYKLSDLKGQEFIINKTEKVGNNIWYRGVLDGKTTWIHSSYLNPTFDKMSQYNVTFEEALKKQMTANPPPQTDKYANQNVFVEASAVKDIEKTALISANSVNLRKTPFLNDNSKENEKVNINTRVIIVGEVKGDAVSGNTIWYKIKYNNKTLHVHSSLANPNAIVGKIAKKSVNVYERGNKNSHIFGTISENTRINIIKEGANWHEISFQTWRNAKEKDVISYLDPNQNDHFQHLLLSGSAGLTASDLGPLLKEKGILKKTEQAFINASRLYDVNEVYLVAHALHETGNGTSTLANGVEVGKNSNGALILVNDNNRKNLTNIKKVYNMYGIGAVDSNALEGGAKKAYEEDWTSPVKAIEGGGEWISNDYINGVDKNGVKYEQDTLYKMKWNPKSPGTHQYATDMGWAIKQISKIRMVYDQLPQATKRFDTPQYK